MAHGDRWVQPQPTEWARDCSSKPGVGYLKSAPLPFKDYTGTCGIRVYYVTVFENQAQRLSMWLNTHQDSEPGFSSKVAIHICHYSQWLLSFFNFTKPVMSHFFISKDHLQYFLHRSYALKPFSPAPTPPQKDTCCQLWLSTFFVIVKYLRADFWSWWNSLLSPPFSSYFCIHWNDSPASAPRSLPWFHIACKSWPTALPALPVF